MKKIAVLGGMAVLLLGATWSILMTPSEVKSSKTVEVEKIVEVDSLEERVKKAQSEAEAEIREASQKAYDALYQEKMKAVEDSVKMEYIAEIEATITDPSY